MVSKSVPAALRGAKPFIIYILIIILIAPCFINNILDYSARTIFDDYVILIILITPFLIIIILIRPFLIIIILLKQPPPTHCIVGPTRQGKVSHGETFCQCLYPMIKKSMMILMMIPVMMIMMVTMILMTNMTNQ